MNAKAKWCAVQPRAAGFYDPDEVSARSGLRCEDPSLTVQSQAEEADINVIVKRFGITGALPVHSRVPFPSDVEFEDFDFRAAHDVLLQASRSFASLPAEVRSRFGNDPVAFADYAVAPENLPQLRSWGLAPPAPPEAEKPA